MFQVQIIDTGYAIDKPQTTASGVINYFAYINATTMNDITSGSTFTTPLDIATQYTWRNSPVPLWSNTLSQIKKYETKYNLNSKQMYEEYESNNLRQRVSNRDLKEWLNSYLIYAD